MCLLKLNSIIRRANYIYFKSRKDDNSPFDRRKHDIRSQIVHFGWYLSKRIVIRSNCKKTQYDINERFYIQAQLLCQWGPRCPSQSGPGPRLSSLCFIEAVKLLSGVARGPVLSGRQLVLALSCPQWGERRRISCNMTNVSWFPWNDVIFFFSWNGWNICLFL